MKAKKIKILLTNICCDDKITMLLNDNGGSMKKRILMIAMFAMFCVPFAACGKKNINEDVVVGANTSEDKEITNESNNGNSENAKDNDSANLTDAQSGDIEKLPVILLESENSIKIFKDGEEVVLYQMSDTEERMGSYYTQELYGEYVYDVKAIYGMDTCISFEVYNFDGEKVFEYAFADNAAGFQILEYGDKVCVVHDIRNDDFGYENKLRVYVYEPQSRKYDYDSHLSEMVNKANSAEYTFPGHRSSVLVSYNNDPDNIYAWNYRDRSFALIDPDSMEEKEHVVCDIADKSPYCLDFSGNQAIMCVSENYENNSYYLADMKTGKTEEIVAGNVGYIGVWDGVFYYYPIDETTYKNSHNEINAYDMNTKTSKVIFSADVKPGDGFVNAGITDFTVKDNYILYRDTDENGEFLRVYDISAGKVLDNKLAYEKTKYGDYASFEVYDVRKAEDANECDGNNAYFLGYVEKVILNSNIRNADKINADLLKLYNEEVDYCKEVENDTLEIMSEYDYDGPANSYDFALNRINEIGSDYLQVYFEYYVFQGGAHGFGGYVTKLYNLNTGEPVEFKDICGVDFETYKRILIDKTIEDWKNAEDYVYFYTYTGDDEEENTFYNELMEDIVDFERFPICYGKDSLVVSYPPYMYGPYASGYIGIEITYDELCMDINK